MLHRLIFVPARLVQAVPVVLGVTLIVFFMSHLLPGDPALAILGDKATPESVSALRDQLGLDQPIWQRYVHFLSNIVHGDLGTSFTYQRPVTDVVLQAVPVTLTLVALALLLNIVISVPLAGLAAMKPNRTPDLIVRALNMVGQGMPQFWVGIMLILLFGVRLRWFPVGGYGDTPLQHLYYLLLPALTLAIALSPTTIRSLRSSTITVLGSDYVATARSKGLSGLPLFRRHVLRNSGIPTVSIVGVHLANLVGGSIVIEKVFAIPGLGSVMLDAIYARDFPSIQAVTLVVALLVTVASILTDVLYVVMDPRVSLGTGVRV